MRSPVHAGAAAIAATTILGVALVINILTGVNAGPLSAPPAFAVDSCAVSSDSSSSISSTSGTGSSAGSCSATADDVINAMQQAATAQNNALDATNDANTALHTDATVLATLQTQYQSVYMPKCGANEEIVDAIDSAHASLTAALNALDLASSYLGFSASAYDIGTLHFQQGDYCQAISDYNHAASWANKASSQAAFAACEEAAAEAELVEIGSLLNECNATSSDSSSDSSSNSSIRSSSMSSSSQMSSLH